MKRITLFVLLSAVLFVSISTAASAGGWAVVTLDAMPTNVVVGVPVSVGMSIRQHGITPVDIKLVRVRVSHPISGSVMFNAFSEGKGHYTVDLTFDEPGTWQWAVASGFMPEWQEMPPIEVADSVQEEFLLAQANIANSATLPTLATMMPSMLMLAVGVLGFVVFAGGLVVWVRSQR